MTGLQILGTGRCLPQRCVTNDNLAAVVDTSDQWITTRTGIRQRYFCQDGEGVVHLAAGAARKALEAAGIEPDQLGLIVTAVAAPLCKRLMATVIVYMSFGLLMAVLWVLLESPDLAVTEAAVGVGVTTILFFLTLRRIHELKGTKDE